MRTAIVVALVAGSLALAPSATAASHQVRVEDNIFTPKVLEIAPGDSVVWNALRAGHTITADDGRFDFHRERVLNVGEQVSWRFDAEENFRYYCKIHGGPGGQGMAGVIRVGDPPRAPVPQKPSVVVPDDAPTIRDAVEGARPGTEILVRPGDYAEEVVASVPGVVLRGLGGGSDEVVLQGGGARDVGVTVTASGVRIENLTVAGYRSAGIAIGSVSGSFIHATVLKDNGLYGVNARAPAGLTVRAAHIAGHGIAGISVRDCEACGARIDGGSIERNAAGIVAVSATGVVVRGTKVHGNAVGLVLRDVVRAHVTGNTLTDNNATDLWVAAIHDGPELPSGAGVSISGGRGNLIASNTIAGHVYNVAIIGPGPSLEHRIDGNSVADSVHADLGWDGVGAGVCFSGNRSSAGDSATTDPPWLAPLADCDRPATVGVPYPVVTANVLRHAHKVGWPA